ncbi:Spindle and kinetochore-associated protein 1-like [Homarus americanus]|uniref:SKA complex subunit 1 n=2 Tax=Homarus americanus TaxID=6706 RepID=A0A8J5JQH9_HOMAM|nr:Spindle and kinetochore-associated protein 1-like [Homarus americanus]
MATAQKDIVTAHCLLEQMQQLSKRLTHMKTNLPVHIPNVNASPPVVPAAVSQPTTKQTNINKQNEQTYTQEKSKVKTGSGKAKQIPIIEYVTIEEFESVPKYIRGRLQYDQVNNTVNAINKTLESKYTLMARPRSKISEVDMRIVTACRRQENQETRDLHFVVDDDIKRWGNMKLDTAGRSLMTVLRTLKRLREVRGPGNLVRFAVIT